MVRINTYCNWLIFNNSWNLLTVFGNRRQSRTDSIMTDYRRPSSQNDCCRWFLTHFIPNLFHIRPPSEIRRISCLHLWGNTTPTNVPLLRRLGTDDLAAYGRGQLSHPLLSNRDKPLSAPHAWLNIPRRSDYWNLQRLWVGLEKSCCPDGITGIPFATNRW